MKRELIWYNPAEKEYQIGDREEYASILRNSNQAENFVILDVMPEISKHFREKLLSKLRFLNSMTKSGMMEYI